MCSLHEHILHSIMDHVMIHCTVKENLLSHQGFLQNGPDDFFAITLSPIERFRSTCINLFPESFVCGMHDASVPQDLGELLSDGNNR